MMPLKLLKKGLITLYDNIRFLFLLLFFIVAASLSLSAPAIGALGTGITMGAVVQRLFTPSLHAGNLLGGIVSVAALMPSYALYVRILGFTTEDARPRWQRWGANMLYYSAIVGVLRLTWLLNPASGKH